MTKPVIAYIAGFTAPPGKTMGHAGAIISGSAGTAQAKKEALEAHGVRVGTNPTEVAQLVAEVVGTARLRGPAGPAQYTQRVSVISFARGMPGPDLLPIEEFSDCAAAALARDGATALNYGPPGGYPPLREWIAERHGVDPGRVVVTNGSLQGFSFAARHLVKTGRASSSKRPATTARCRSCAASAPRSSRSSLRTTGWMSTLWPVLLRAGDVVYTIPTFQNPSGRTLSRENRFRLLELARERGALVFEDDPYGELRFEGEQLPRLSRSRTARASSSSRRSRRPLRRGSAPAT